MSPEIQREQRIGCEQPNRSITAAPFGSAAQERRVTPSSGQHWDLLDGIRGLAIIMVVFCHGFFANPKGPAWTLWLTAFTGAGSLGVHVFFVLSGFLVAYPFCRARDKDLEAWYVPGYATRRFLKIVPPFYLSIAVLSAFYLWRYHDVGYLFTGLKWTVGMPHLFYEAHWFNGSFWSLWVEVGFYLLLPLAFWLTRGRGLGFATACFATFLFLAPVSFRFFTYPQVDAPTTYLLYFNGRFPNGLTNFAFGVLFAALYCRKGHALENYRRWRWLGYAGAALLLATCTLRMVAVQQQIFSQQILSELLIHLAGLATFLMLFFLFEPRCRGGRLFSQPALRYIGLVSYEWFLLHQPALMEFRSWMGGASGALGRYCVIVLAPMVLTFLLAVAMYHFFSLPIIQWGRNRLESNHQRAAARTGQSLQTDPGVNLV